MRAPKLAWALLLACVAAAGAALLITASLVSGQHGHGHWVQPAKLIGVSLLVLAGLSVWLLLAGPGERDR